MTGWKALRLRTDLIADQLAWGFGDLGRLLAEKGLLPAMKRICVSSAGDSCMVIGQRFHIKSDAGAPDCLAISESDCLWGEVQLPAMSSAALQSAVAEMLWRESPLPPDQMVAAWRASPAKDGVWTVEWAICKRGLQEALQKKFSLPQKSLTFMTRDDTALLVQDHAALKYRNKQRLLGFLGYFLVFLVVLSLCVLVLTPIGIKRQGAVLATQKLASLEGPAAPLRQKLDTLRHQTKLATDIRISMGVAVPSALVVEALSSALPDDTWLDRLDINENEIRITGMAANANDLITYLGRSTFFSDVKATAPNVRDATLNKERFSFEMKWREEFQQ